MSLVVSWRMYTRNEAVEEKFEENTKIKFQVHISFHKKETVNS